MRRLTNIVRRIILGALVCLVALSYFTLPAEAIVQGSGQTVYGEGTVATPRNRELRNQESTWTTEASLATNSATGAQYKIKGAPTRNEMIAGSVNQNGVLRVYRWNGTTWSSEWNVTVGSGTGNVPRFDIVYQATSGSAMVFYSRNVATTNELGYRTWNGTSWTAETTYDCVRTSGVIDLIVAKNRPGTNEIAVAWGDLNRDLSIQYYTGSAMTSEPTSLIEDELGRASATTNIIQSQDFDIAFEEVSGRLILAWGNDWSMNMRYSIRSAGTAGTWGAAISVTSFNTQGAMLKMASLPGSNFIAYVNHGNWNFNTNSANEMTEAGVWNGSAWTVSSTFTSNTLTVGQHDVSVGWFTSGATTKALFTYDKTSSAGVDYFTYDKTGNTFSASSTFATAPAPAATNDETHLLTTNPFALNEAIALVSDSADDLFAKKVTFDGSNFTFTGTEPSATALEATLPALSNTSGWLATFDYNRFIPATVLSTDIVTNAGASVTSPAFAFSAITGNTACQTPTATLGDATNQRLRVTNTTGTPTWTLTIAPTGGATANWSATTDSYDFNDPTGSGCNDGPDADSLAGQLTITPSSGTKNTTKTGCTTTNVNLASAASFNQGVTNSVTIATASASAQIDCIWDFYSIPMSQKVPAYRLPGSYSLPMTLTVTAS